MSTFHSRLWALCEPIFICHPWLVQCWVTSLNWRPQCFLSHNATLWYHSFELSAGLLSILKSLPSHYCMRLRFYALSPFNKQEYLRSREIKWLSKGLLRHEFRISTQISTFLKSFSRHIIIHSFFLVCVGGGGALQVIITDSVRMLSHSSIFPSTNSVPGIVLKIQRWMRVFAFKKFPV